MLYLFCYPSASLWRFFEIPSFCFALTLLSSYLISVILVTFFLVPGSVCWSTSLSRWVIPLHPAPIESNKVVMYVLRRLDCIVCWFAVVPPYHVLNFRSLARIDHDATDSVLLGHVNIFVWCRLSVPCIDVVLSFADRVVLCVIVTGLFTYDNDSIVAWSIDMVFSILSPSIANVAGKTLIILNGPRLAEINLF